VTKDPEIRSKRCWTTPSIFRWLGLGTVLGLPWFIIDTHADVSIFLELKDKDNKIEGEVNTKGHKGEIDVLSMNFGASSSSTALDPKGEPKFQDIGITKYTDKSTPELMRRLLTGRPISSAKLKFVETIKGEEVPVVTFELKDSLVTSYSSAGYSGAERPLENLTLDFQQVSVQTFSYDGSPSSGSNSIVTWDSRTGKGTLVNGSNNTPPTITAIGAQTIAEDTSTPNILFTIGDAETPAGSLTISTSTNDPLVVPLSGISLSGTGQYRGVTITPAPNANGSATISITVTDRDGLTATTSFTVTVNAVNDAPTIQAITNQVTKQNQAITIGINVSDIDTTATGVTVFASFSETPSLIPTGNITFSGSGAATRMTLTPVTGQSGSALITVRANDGVDTSFPASFTLTVSPITSTAATRSGGTQSSPSSVDQKVTDAQATDVKKDQQSATAAATSGATDASSPFNQWRQKHFPTQIDDLSTTGSRADFDKDGIANLLEYGVGSDPKDPTDGPGLVVFTEEIVEGIAYPAIRFKRLIGKLDPSLIVNVELATDQFDWRTKPGDTVEVRSTPFSETHEEVVIRSSLPISGAVRQMMRLHFSLAP
jgi:type VI secretion system Hcp family effector